VERNNLGVLLKDLGRFEEAASAYRKALELDPHYAPAHHNLGEILQRRGDLEGARRCFTSALQFDPNLTQARLSLGNVLTDLGQFPAAVSHYRQALAVAENPAARLSLGVALQRMGDLEGTLREFNRVAAAAPALVEARLNLANALLECGRASEAADHLRAAILLRPDFPGAQILLGVAVASRGDMEEGAAILMKALPAGTTEARAYVLLGANLVNLGQSEPALACFEKALERDPDAAGVRHFMDALRGVNPARPPDEYVRDIFDSYAGDFDKHLVEELGYGVPRELACAVLELPGPVRPWDVLDLGCGTGLVGMEIAAHASSLVGVDLSERMLERARDRKIYTSLHCTDLTTALGSTGTASFDLVAAADVFVYVGALDTVIPAVRRVLRPGGLFAFSTEAGDDTMTEGYSLRRSGRYAHQVEYLDRLAAGNGFRIGLARPTRIRLERGKAVSGWLSVWTAT
jgi:predicted TPR repeat methyltransferase